MNRDAMTNANLKNVAGAAQDALDRLQRHPKGVQAPAVCSLFLALSEATGVSIQDLLEITQRMTRHADGRRPEFAAVVDYMRGELADV